MLLFRERYPGLDLNTVRYVDEPAPVYSSDSFDLQFRKRLGEELGLLEPVRCWTIAFFRIVRSINCVCCRLGLPVVRTMTLEQCVEHVQDHLTKLHREVQSDEPGGWKSEFQICSFIEPKVGLSIIFRFKSAHNMETSWLVLGEKVILKRRGGKYNVFELREEEDNNA